MKNDTSKIASDFTDCETLEYIQCFMLNPYYSFRDSFHIIQDIMFVPEKFAYNISGNPVWDEDFMYLSFRFDPRTEAEKMQKNIFDMFDDCMPFEDMKIRKVSERLKATHVKNPLISKN